VKIKQWSRKQSFLLRLRFRRLRSSQNHFVGFVSRKGKTKPITKRENEHCDWFILLLLLPTPTIWFSLDRKQRNRKRSGKKMETFWFFRLRFRRANDSAYDSDFWFSLGHKRSYDSAYDSDSNSVGSENQPLEILDWQVDIPPLFNLYLQYDDGDDDEVTWLSVTSRGPPRSSCHFFTYCGIQRGRSIRVLIILITGRPEFVLPGIGGSLLTSLFTSWKLKFMW